MKCKEIESHIADYLSGKLNKQDRKSWKEHLKQCASCQKMVLDMEASWKQMGDLPEAVPGHSLRKRFYTMLAEEKAKTRSKRSLRDRLNRYLAPWWPKEPAVQLALTLGVVMIALLMNYGFKNQIGNGSELTALKRELKSLQQTVSLALLDHEAATDRLQGIQFTKQLSEPDAILLNRLIDRLNHDPSINVRLAAADALYLFGNYPLVRDQLSASLQYQKSPLVQIALIDLLSDLRIQRASQALKMLIQNQAVETEVRDHAQNRLNDMM